MSTVDRAGPQAGRPDEEELAHLVALNSLHGLGPLRLAALLEGRSAGEAWALLRRGQVPPEVRALGLGGRLAREWAEEAGRTEPADELRRYRLAGVEVLVPTDDRYPDRLAECPDAPPVLFAQGDVGAAHQCLVAIVGTRRATPYGLRLARRFAHELAEAGLGIVSGLAVGIDAAAHTGTLEGGGASPVGVIGSGLDVVYPRRNRQLWEEVRRRGVLLGEAGLGAPPERWRFPARNRIVAALAEAVLVVESHVSGGSLITALQAGERGRAVLAVPGSVLSPASAGTNALIADGATIACETEDVLVALGRGGLGRRRPPSEPPPQATPDEARVLEALGWEPARVDELALRSGLGMGPLAVAIDGLERRGALTRHRGMVLRAK